MAKSIQFTRVYNFPIADLWEALTNADAMSTWLMPCNFKPEIGHEFEFKTKAYPGFDGITRCKVLELKTEELLSFSWSGGSLKNTVVTFKLEALGATKTQLNFEHSGFEGFVNSVIVRRILASGWTHKILPIYLPNYLAKSYPNE